ncbi:MAG: hypothetical protein PHI12_07510 [Dehalococcoidales bacterium]|nr:hypothetical protein [Dehalococcoidales bacterium]
MKVKALKKIQSGLKPSIKILSLEEDGAEIHGVVKYERCLSGLPGNPFLAILEDFTADENGNLLNISMHRLRG